MTMLLTTRQVAQKLGVKMNIVGVLVRTGKLATANPPEPGKRVEHQFDPKVVREFASTYTPPQKRTPKVKKVEGNGHAPEAIPMSSDAYMNYLIGTRVELGTRLGIIEERLAKLMASWGVE